VENPPGTGTVIRMTVGVNQRLDRLVGEAAKVGKRFCRGFGILQRIDNQHTIGADHHRHVGIAVANRDEEAIGNLVDALLHCAGMGSQVVWHLLVHFGKGEVFTSEEYGGRYRHRHTSGSGSSDWTGAWIEGPTLANSINQGDLTANLDHFDTIRRPDFG